MTGYNTLIVSLIISNIFMNLICREHTRFEWQIIYFRWGNSCTFPVSPSLVNLLPRHFTVLYEHTSRTFEDRCCVKGYTLPGVEHVWEQIIYSRPHPLHRSFLRDPPTWSRSFFDGNLMTPINTEARDTLDEGGTGGSLIT